MFSLWYHEGAMSAKAALFAAILLPVISIPSFCQAPTSQQGQIGLHERLAQQYLKQQRPDLAIPELQKLVELDPGNVEARGNLGVLLFFRGDYKAAVPHLREAVRLQPDLWKVQALLGMA